MGCCFSSQPPTCYYSMDSKLHFVSWHFHTISFPLRHNCCSCWMCESALVGTLVVEYNLPMTECKQGVPLVTTVTSWDLRSFIKLTFTKLCHCLFPACSIDRHFVFSVPAALVDPPISPAMLRTLGNTTCKPERVTSEYALFKIPMDGCGAHKVVSCGEQKQYYKFDPIWYCKTWIIMT